MNDHLKVTTTGRGFDHMPSIPSAYGGTVRIYESSAATGPHLWLSAVEPLRPNDLSGPSMDATLHLTAENAWRLAEQLMTLVRDHYQGDARPEQRVADFTEPGLGRAVELLREWVDGGPEKECTPDHDGYCQAHSPLVKECVFGKTQDFLAEVTE